MFCDERPRGRKVTVSGNGIGEPPYVLLVRCPFESEYYKQPDDECCYLKELSGELESDEP